MCSLTNRLKGSCFLILYICTILIIKNSYAVGTVATNSSLSSSGHGQHKKTVSIENLLKISNYKALVQKVLNDNTNPFERIVTQQAQKYSLTAAQLKTTLLQERNLSEFRHMLVNTIDEFLDYETIVAIETFFSTHSLEQFLLFQNALATLIANTILMQQTVLLPHVATTLSLQANRFLDKIIEIRKQENPFVFKFVNVEPLRIPVVTLCCSYFDEKYLQDLCLFVNQPTGKLFIVRYGKIEKAIKLNFVTWVTNVAQKTGTIPVTLTVTENVTTFCKTMDCPNTTLVVAGHDYFFSMLHGFKDNLLALKDRLESKIRSVCSGITQIALQCYLRINRAAIEKLPTILDRSVDVCLANISAARNKKVVFKSTEKPKIDSSKEQLIEQLFNLLQLHMVAQALSILIINAIPDTALEQTNIQAILIETLKQEMAISFNAQEISSLVNFLSGETKYLTKQSIANLATHGPEFKQLILINLKPEVVTTLREVLPWHLIL